MPPTNSIHFVKVTEVTKRCILQCVCHVIAHTVYSCNVAVFLNRLDLKLTLAELNCLNHSHEYATRFSNSKSDVYCSLLRIMKPTRTREIDRIWNRATNDIDKSASATCSERACAGGNSLQLTADDMRQVNVRTPSECGTELNVTSGRSRRKANDDGVHVCQVTAALTRSTTDHTRRSLSDSRAWELTHLPTNGDASLLGYLSPPALTSSQAARCSSHAKPVRVTARIIHCVARCQRPPPLAPASNSQYPAS